MTSQVWLTAAETAERLRFPTTKAFYEFQRRHRGLLIGYKRGGTWLYSQVDVDAVPQRQGAASRRQHLGAA